MCTFLVLCAGDGHVDWDEFTSFCIHTGLVGGASDGYGVSPMDSYVIEYIEDFEIKDTTMANHAAVTNLRHAPTIKRLIATQEKDNRAYMFDEHLQPLSCLDPAEVLDHDGKLVPQHPALEALRVLDILYLPCKDLYAYSASDHTINFCREHTTIGRKTVHYSLCHRINHAYLQVKLCWSEHSKILCSVDSGEHRTCRHCSLLTAPCASGLLLLE